MNEEEIKSIEKSYDDLDKGVYSILLGMKYIKRACENKLFVEHFNKDDAEEKKAVEKIMQIFENGEIAKKLEEIHLDEDD